MESIFRWAVSLALSLSLQAKAGTVSITSAEEQPPVATSCASRLFRAPRNMVGNLFSGPLMPATSFASSLGLQYDREVTYDFQSINTYINSGFHEMATVHRFESKKFVTEVTRIEMRPGIALAVLQKIAAAGLPPIRDMQGKVISFDNPYPQNFSDAAEINLHYLAELTPDQIEILSHLLEKDHYHGLFVVYFNRIQEYVDFANKQYERRGWSPKMLENLSAEATEFYEQSTYVALSSKEGGANGREKLVGTLRLIHAPYKKKVTKWLASGQEEIFFTNGSLHRERFGQVKEKTNNFYSRDTFQSLDPAWDKIPKHGGPPSNISTLMMEVSQNVTLPRPAGLTWKGAGVAPGQGPYEVWEGEGEIIEPGTVAIDKEYNADGFSEILAQLMVQILDPGVSAALSNHSRYYYTYNDRPLIYEMLGFKKLEDKPYKQEWNAKTGKMEDWWLMGASVKDLSDMANGLVQKRRHLDAKRLSEIREMIFQSVKAIPYGIR